MKRLILGSTALVGVASLANAAQASDGIKLDVGGFFQTVYQGVFDNKGSDAFGNHRNTDRFVHNAEVWFKGNTTLDNGLTVGAQIELEGENANDQIDKSFVYWSGGFGKVQIGSQDSVIGACPVFPPGATANFSAFSPASWGSNDPIGSNSVCTDAVGGGNSQSIKYTTPNFGGFQLALAYTPSGNAEDYTQAGVVQPTDGKTQVDTPKQMFASEITWRDAGWFASLRGKYTGKRYYTYTNDQGFGGYTVFDAAGGYDFGEVGLARSMKVSFNVTNLTDKRYASNLDSSVFAPTDPAGTIYVFHASAPRQAFMSLDLRF